MSSIIPGYEYDIFISYRQKDNKHDGWVTEFVDNLKGELESTFKEEISVYFDINPHDGLLETHDVDASLKEKLKCLIFIPVISRTYCDPRSFAWEHEFKAFVEIASQDQFGLKVKLPGGNIASRILPVQIHDLNAEDRTLVEGELGGYLRGIEFIYKEPGVNRPLRSNEDHPDNNLNKTFYRNQINKVANAINEIIDGLKDPDHYGKVISENVDEKNPLKVKNHKTKIITGALLLLALIVVGYFIIPKFIKPKEKLEKSIAVLPFLNIMEDADNEWWSIALADEIINHLYKIKSFDRVVDINTVTVYRNTNKKNDRITNELDVSYLLRGSYKMVGDHIKVTVHLVDPKNDTYLWQHDYDKIYSAKEVITLLADIALQVADQLKAELTESESKNIMAIGTTNREAYEEIQKAKSEFLAGKGEFYELVGSGLKSARHSIELDSGYAEAYAYASLFSGLAGGYAGAGGQNPEEIVNVSLFYARKALSLDPDNALAHFILANFYYYSDWNYIMADREFQKARELEPNNKNSITTAGYLEFLIKGGKYKDAMSLIIDEKLDHNKNDNSVPIILINTGKIKEAQDIEYSLYDKNFNYAELALGERLIWFQEYDSAIFYINKGIPKDKVAASTPRFQSYLAIAYYKTGKIKVCRQILKQLINRSTQTTWGSPDFFIGKYYSAINMKDSAMYWLENAFNNHSMEMTWIKADPLFYNLKDDPRYLDLYKRTGFKAYDDYMAAEKKK
jgi:TolB-like protein